MSEESSRVDTLEETIHMLERELSVVQEKLAIAHARERRHKQIAMLRSITQGVHQESHKATAQDMLEEMESV